MGRRVNKQSVICLVGLWTIIAWPWEEVSRSMRYEPIRALSPRGSLDPRWMSQGVSCGRRDVGAPWGRPPHAALPQQCGTGFLWAQGRRRQWRRAAAAAALKPRRQAMISNLAPLGLFHSMVLYLFCNIFHYLGLRLEHTDITFCLNIGYKLVSSRIGLLLLETMLN